MVTVRFNSGDEKIFRMADSAYPFDHRHIVVAKWNTKRQKLEELAVFRAEDVIVAEVSKNGVVTNGVLGRAVRPN